MTGPIKTSDIFRHELAHVSFPAVISHGLTQIFAGYITRGLAGKLSYIIL